MHKTRSLGYVFLDFEPNVTTASSVNTLGVQPQNELKPPVIPAISVLDLFLSPFIFCSIAFTPGVNFLEHSFFFCHRIF